ncbi:MAG: DUF4365 domain-containing protein [Gemmataceae bacterium]|nr:DUF4365 domain-containing protein [Gemmataceae bacterium]
MASSLEVRALSKGRQFEPRKRRTREHVLADLGVHHVEGHILRCGYTVKRIGPDYGLDLALTTYSTRGDVEPGLIWLQVKATVRPKRPKDADSLAIRIERRDLVSWIDEQYPVIFVVYDATKDRAYWLHVQREFGSGKLFALSRRGSRLTVHVDMTQVVGEQAIREWRRRKQDAWVAWRKGAGENA